MRVKTIKIPLDLVAELDNMAEAYNKRIKHTPEQLEIIHKYWKVKRHSDFVKWFRDKYGWGCKTTFAEIWEKMEKESKKEK